MWYFTWILGLGAALAFGIINVMWLEASYTFGELDEDRIRERFAKPPERCRRLNAPDPQPPATQAGDAAPGRGRRVLELFRRPQGRDMLQDAATIKPLHVVIVGLAGRPPLRAGAGRARDRDHPHRRVGRQPLSARDFAERRCGGRNSVSVVSTSGQRRSHSPRASVTMPRAASSADHRRRRAMCAPRRTHRDPPCRRVPSTPRSASSTTSRRCISSE